MAVYFDQDSDINFWLSILQLPTITTTSFLTQTASPKHLALTLGLTVRTPSSDYNIAFHHDPANALTKEIFTS